MVQESDIDQDIDNLRPTPVTQDLQRKQPRTVSHQQILTSESTREMTLTKKAMQVASRPGPSKSITKQTPTGVRNSEAKPILSDLLEDKKVLSRSLAETRERINEIETMKQAVLEASNKLAKHIWLPKVICIFSPYQYYDKYVAIVDKLIKDIQSD